MSKKGSVLTGLVLAGGLLLLSENYKNWSIGQSQNLVINTGIPLVENIDGIRRYIFANPMDIVITQDETTGTYNLGLSYINKDTSHLESLEFPFAENITPDTIGEFYDDAMLNNPNNTSVVRDGNYQVFVNGLNEVIKVTRFSSEDINPTGDSSYGETE